MYRSGKQLVVSASDLVGFLECAHLTRLTLDSIPVAVGKVARVGAQAQTVAQRRGLEHEATYLEQLRRDGKSIVEIDGMSADHDTLRAHAEQTAQAVAAGVDVIYQATFLDELGGVWWRGHADFLELAGAGPAAGQHLYEPVDTKLAHRMKPAAVLQLCQYAAQLTAVQGVEPGYLRVELGNGTRARVAFASVAAYFRLARSRFVDALTTGVGQTYPHPVEHCTVCRFGSGCDQQRRADDHLTLVAGLGREQARKLNIRNITTVAQLAALADGIPVPGMGAHVVERVRQQAKLQLEARKHPNRPPPFEVIEPSGPDRGLEALPEPTPADLYFDMEGDPYVGSGGLEYMFGIGWLDGNGRFVHRAFWGHDDAEERTAFEALVDFIGERRAADRGLHVYHYAPYEPSALGRLMGKHGTREAEVDALFIDRVLVDLYRVVLQGVRVGTESYSIKSLEPLYMKPRKGAIKDAGSSIDEYEEWLETGDPQILVDLEEYNRDDCESTYLLHRWLEARRPEAEARFGKVLERRTVPEAAPTAAAGGDADDEDTPVTASGRSLVGLADDLAAAATAIDEAPSPDGQQHADALNLLAHLLQWHRREDKPEWWRYFSRIDGYAPGELVEDTECIDGLVYDGVAGHVGKSTLHRYRFDPDQEHQIRVGDTPHDPAVEGVALVTGIKGPKPGTVVELDSAEGIVVLKRSNTSTAAHPTALIPQGPLQTKVMRDAIARVAEWCVDQGIDAPGPYRAVRDLLSRQPPRIRKVKRGTPLRQPGEGTVEAATRLCLGLDHSYLPIQGPPGTGKTYTAARAIVALVGAGKRVGITANSHAVITNLLKEVMDAAAQDHVTVTAVQKTDTAGCEHPNVIVTTDNAAVEGALAQRTVGIVAGTAWLFSRAALAGSLDHLFIDEAGQMSLANVVAVSGAADNLVLVGDPQQLPQPSKGTHPPGVGVTALEHVLHGRPTIPADLGLFLDTTWRMHPDVCRYISELAYEGQLESEPSCSGQQVQGNGSLSGTGLHWLPVEHDGNRLSSVEEAAAVAHCYNQLLGRTWVDAKGLSATIGPADILIVAPYNAQVHTLVQHLPPGARVGTVDKFQGQQAAVSIVSLAASDTDEIPRGMEFLFSMNRLNVAVSRAKALTIIVASPALLAVRCRTVAQMQLVNGLCRFVELAEPVTLPKATGRASKPR